MRVCAGARDGREAVALAELHRPDVAIIDLGMPDLNGIEATRRIRQQVPSTEVLIYSIHQTEHLIREAVLAGARGFVLKSDAAQQLVPAIRSLAAHKPFFSVDVSATLLKGLVFDGPVASDDLPAPVNLTSREREVMQLLAEGWVNGEIALRLEISVKTVESHRSAVMRKLNLKSLVDLVHYAIRNGIVLTTLPEAAPLVTSPFVDRREG
jgi:DNA-binding NarL/FixJ family response regulator